jgi:sarcosine oxidase subunit beta
MKRETLIIGAGVIGSAVAMHLAKRGVAGIRVVDFDLEGSLSSSELNAGGVRATWMLPLNIDMSKLSIEYFAKHADEMGYRACGYLWLHGAEKLPAALKAREGQVARGWPVEAWGVAELRRRVPFIDKTDDIAGALFAPRDGLINPNLCKNHFRNEARKLGVQFEDRVMVRRADHAAAGVTLHAEKFEGVLSHDAKLEVLSLHVGVHARKTVTYECERVINCAGPWAAHVAGLLGYQSPSHPVRRQISIFDCREVDLTPYGMIVDTSGVYFHPEATNGLAGFALPEPPGINYAYDGESFFQETLWPALYERSSKFEALKHVTGWAGLYEVSPDESAILGSVKGFPRLFEAHSFSGHGVMHSHAAGIALAEWICDGKFSTLDASPLAPDRFERGQAFREHLII